MRMTSETNVSEAEDVSSSTFDAEGPGLAAAQQVVEGAGVRDAAVDAERAVKTRTDVAHRTQFTPDRALLQASAYSVG